MRVIAIIASENGQLPRGDRAAVEWALLSSSTQDSVIVFHRSGDHVTASHVRAVGATAQVWNNERITFDLALLGPGAIDQWGDELAGRWTEAVQGSLVFDAQYIARGPRGWFVTCDAGRGAREVVEVFGPAVLVLSNDVPRPAYVSRYRLAARRPSQGEQQVGTVTVGRMNGTSRTANELDPAWAPVTPRVPRSVADSGAADSRTNAAFGLDRQRQEASRGTIDAEDAATCAETLLRYLAHHGFIERSIVGPHHEAVAEERPAARTTSDDQGSAEVVRGQCHVPVAAAAKAADPIVSARLLRRPRSLTRQTTRESRGPFPSEPCPTLGGKPLHAERI